MIIISASEWERRGEAANSVEVAKLAVPLQSGRSTFTSYDGCRREQLHRGCQKWLWLATSWLALSIIPAISWVAPKRFFDSTWSMKQSDHPQNTKQYRLPNFGPGDHPSLVTCRQTTLSSSATATAINAPCTFAPEQQNRERMLKPEEYTVWMLSITATFGFQVYFP